MGTRQSTTYVDVDVDVDNARMISAGNGGGEGGGERSSVDHHDNHDNKTSCSTATVFTWLSLPQGVNHVTSSVVSGWQYDTASSEGSHDPDMMTEVLPRFEPFERCCMAILFVGGRGKTTPHPTSPPLLG